MIKALCMCIYYLVSSYFCLHIQYVLAKSYNHNKTRFSTIFVTVVSEVTLELSIVSISICNGD